MRTRPVLSIAFAAALMPLAPASPAVAQSALSGEGFVCRYRGPGRLYIQTRQLPSFAQQLIPFLPKGGG